LAASANLHFHDPKRPGLFEPVHGSAPDIAGQKRANPCAALLCVALCLEQLGYPEERLRIERAVEEALSAGACTADVGGTLDTEAAGAAVRERLRF
jgi:3-isopropylmalate dehydrogenase